MEEGISHLFLVAKNVTYLKSKIEHNLPKKKTRAVVHDKYGKAQAAFFTKIASAMLKYINLDIVKSIIIASPGYTKNEFFDYLTNEFEQNKYPELKNRKDMILLEHTTSGFKHSLKEILMNKEVQSRISGSEAISEAKLLEEFNEMLRKNPERAAYGKRWIERAIEQHAVATLLISDKVLKTRSYGERDRYVRLTKNVESAGGSVVFFSSMHPTGEALNDMTGIAAILKYPVPDPADEEEDEKAFKAAEARKGKEEDEDEEEEKGQSADSFSEEALGKLLTGLGGSEDAEEEEKAPAGQTKKPQSKPATEASEGDKEEVKKVMMPGQVVWRKKAQGKSTGMPKGPKKGKKDEGEEEDLSPDEEEKPAENEEETTENKAPRKKSMGGKKALEEELKQAERTAEEKEVERKKVEKEQKVEAKRERDEKRKAGVKVPKSEKTKRTKQEWNVKRDQKSEREDLS